MYIIDNNKTAYINDKNCTLSTVSKTAKIIKSDTIQHHVDI